MDIKEINKKQEEYNDMINLLEVEIFQTKEKLVKLVNKYLELTGQTPKDKLTFSKVADIFGTTYDNINTINGFLKLFGKNIF